ncbi:MAG: hypothetical protein R6U53_02060 [Natronomonas sp.]
MHSTDTVAGTSPEPLFEPLQQLADAYDGIREAADFRAALRG